jgi:O-antigen/teichoic acid export membrane protein
VEPLVDAVTIGQTVADNREPSREQARSGFLGPLLNGLAWTAAAKWSTQLVSWGSTVVVVRLLTPVDFGIVGMATVYFGFVTILSECGLGSAVVYKRTLTDAQIDQLNSLSLLLGIAAFALSCALSVPLASFFRTPELAFVILLMSTTFIISAFQVVPYALLQRERAFKHLAFADAVRTMCQVTVTVSLAAAGWRYWSLVVGNIVGTAMATAVLLWWRHRPFMRPRRAVLQPAITFSGDVLVSRL